MRYWPISAVRITDERVGGLQRLVRDAVLPYQWALLCDRADDAAPTHCVRNFRIAAGLETGAYAGVVFQDSDLYKWLEAVAYSLTVFPDPARKAQADEVIDLIARAQQPDGYINTYYTVKEPDKRYTNLMEGHELYCAGHLIEAAVAYRQATGEEALLAVAIRLADHIDGVFGPGKRRGYPGHPEIELALVRLFDATGEKRYLRLAAYFLDERGKTPYLFSEPGHVYIFPEMAAFAADYFQAHEPLREQTRAAGHAVRAMYLYSAMADVGMRADDKGLLDAARTLFQNTVERQMYVTGAIGAAALGERFTTDYDLPNDTAYAETCASIGLMMLAKRMFLADGDMRAFDVWQRAFDNAVLAGMDQAGRRFFYVNPLAIVPEMVRANPARGHVKTVRQPWFGVACCPPNLARTIMALGGSMFAQDEDTLYILGHIACAFEYKDIRGRLDARDDSYTLTIDAPAVTIRLREPDGYILDGARAIAHPGGHAVYSYRLTPRVRILRANPRIASDAGKVCVMRGATVYCVEEADNGANLAALLLDTRAPLTERAMAFLPPSMPALVGRGYRIKPDGFGGAPYSDRLPEYEEVALTFVPYSQWNNRGEGEMRVWVSDSHGFPGV